MACSPLRAPAALFARAASCGCWCSPGGCVLFSQGSPRAVLAPHPMAQSKTAPLLASLGSQRGCEAPHVALRRCSWLLPGALLPSLAELLVFAKCLAPSRTLGFSSSPGHGAPAALVAAMTAAPGRCCWLCWGGHTGSFCTESRQGSFSFSAGQRLGEFTSPPTSGCSGAGSLNWR